MVKELIEGSANVIIPMITRPRNSEDWAGAGAYEEAFLRELIRYYAPDKYLLINQNHVFLAKLYEHYVEWGKAWYPNKRGMVGAGIDQDAELKKWAQEFIAKAGGIEKFAFLFQEINTTEEVEIKRLQAEIAQLHQNKQIKNILIFTGALGIAGGVAIIIYKRRNGKRRRNDIRNRGNL